MQIDLTNTGPAVRFVIAMVAGALIATTASVITMREANIQIQTSHQLAARAQLLVEMSHAQQIELIRLVQATLEASPTRPIPRVGSRNTQ